MICEQWDVVAVPFPFMDMLVSKRRPALVISTGEFNTANNHSIMVMITSAKASEWPSDHSLQNLKAAGLAQQCYVRWKVFTLPNEIIERKLGLLADADLAALSAQLSTHFHLQ